MNKIVFIVVVSICTLNLFAENDLIINNYYPKNSWRISSPEEQKMNSRLLNELNQYYKNKGEVVVIRNGYLVSQNKGSELNKVQHIHSCTKTIMALLYGMVFPCESVSKKLIDFFPSYSRNDNSNVTIYHLLTMTSGMDWCDNPNIDSNNLVKESNWSKYILSKHILKKPGSVWNYNSGCSQLLSVIIQDKLNYPLREYANINLLKPLGISNYVWWDSNDGYLTAGWGLNLSIFDLSKIGYLLLRNGNWDGKQVISHQWIQELYKKRMNINNDYSYGYQCWIYNNMKYTLYKANGSYGNHYVMMIICPELDLQVIIAGNINNDIEILNKYILPAIM